MESRLRLDLFAFALGALALLSLAFYDARNGAALVMCALCFAGLLTARLAGFSNRALVPVAVGLVVMLFGIWGLDLPASTRKISAVAHAGGGALVGWAVSEYLRSRIAWPYWGLIALAAVFSVTILWELGEYLGDRAARHGPPAKQDRLVARHLLRQRRRCHHRRPRLAPGAANAAPYSLSRDRARRQDRRDRGRRGRPRARPSPPASPRPAPPSR